MRIRMKIALSILGLALFSLFNAPAQVVTVQLTLEQEQFLPGESLPVTVHIVNSSGQSLHLGADAKWLTFTVESADNNFVVMKNADPPVTAGVTNQPPVVRKYILEEANYLRQQLRMYVLVSDQSGTRILKVSAIGPMVSFSRPE